MFIVRRTIYNYSIYEVALLLMVCWRPSYSWGSYTNLQLGGPTLKVSTLCHQTWLENPPLSLTILPALNFHLNGDVWLQHLMTPEGFNSLILNNHENSCRIIRTTMWINGEQTIDPSWSHPPKRNYGRNWQNRLDLFVWGPWNGGIWGEKWLFVFAWNWVYTN